MSSKPLMSACMHLVESFNLCQITPGPSHKRGHTLHQVVQVFNLQHGTNLCLSVGSEAVLFFINFIDLTS